MPAGVSGRDTRQRVKRARSVTAALGWGPSAGRGRRCGARVFPRPDVPGLRSRGCRRSERVERPRRRPVRAPDRRGVHQRSESPGAAAVTGARSYTGGREPRTQRSPRTRVRRAGRSVRVRHFIRRVQAELVVSRQRVKDGAPVRACDVCFLLSRRGRLRTDHSTGSVIRGAFHRQVPFLRQGRCDGA